MKSFLALSLLVSALGACGKPSDVPALREEAESYIAHAGPRVAALKFRIGTVKAVIDGPDRRFQSAPDFARARFVVNDGAAEVNALENELARAPGDIAKRAEDETGVGLAAFTDEKRELFEAKITRATADAETGEVWLARMQADAAAMIAAANQPARPAAPPTEEKPADNGAPPL